MDGPVCLSPSIEVEKLEEGQTDKGSRRSEQRVGYACFVAMRLLLLMDELIEQWSKGHRYCIG